MENKTGKCFVCGSDNTIIQANYSHDTVFYSCPICGRFEIDADSFIKGDINPNHLAPYLFYHAYPDTVSGKPRYHCTLSEEKCAEYRDSYDRGNNVCGYPMHMDAQMIENWYPNSFAERIDEILLYLGEHTTHFGESIKYEHIRMEVLFFIDLHEDITLQRSKWRDSSACYAEARKLLKYLKEERYISTSESIDGDVYISLEPNGYNRIDSLQRNKTVGKDVLVAMKFGDDTNDVREAIRQGIKDAGYNPIIYDEVENNDYIMPELLKSIRDSRFVVVDLSDHNNGAYLEEGYAMGLGKPVIQVCRKGVTPHFDTAQKNTIVFETEGELPEKLTKRIKATIE